MYNIVSDSLKVLKLANFFFILFTDVTVKYNKLLRLDLLFNCFFVLLVVHFNNISISLRKEKYTSHELFDIKFMALILKWNKKIVYYFSYCLCPWFRSFGPLITLNSLFMVPANLGLYSTNEPWGIYSTVE